MAVDGENTFERRPFLNSSDEQFQLFHDTIVPEIWRDERITSFEVIGNGSTEERELKILATMNE